MSADDGNFCYFLSPTPPECFSTSHVSLLVICITCCWWGIFLLYNENALWIYDYDVLELNSWFTVLICFWLCSTSSREIRFFNQFFIRSMITQLFSENKNVIWSYEATVSRRFFQLVWHLFHINLEQLAHVSRLRTQRDAAIIYRSLVFERKWMQQEDKIDFITLNHQKNMLLF